MCKYLPHSELSTDYSVEQNDLQGPTEVTSPAAYHASIHHDDSLRVTAGTLSTQKQITATDQGGYFTPLCISLRK